MQKGSFIESPHPGPPPQGGREIVNFEPYFARICLTMFAAATARMR
jgi:hypothetical protein